MIDCPEIETPAVITCDPLSQPSPQLADFTETETTLVFLIYMTYTWPALLLLVIFSQCLSPLHTSGGHMLLKIPPIFFFEWVLPPGISCVVISLFLCYAGG